MQNLFKKIAISLILGICLSGELLKNNEDRNIIDPHYLNVFRALAPQTFAFETSHSQLLIASKTKNKGCKILYDTVTSASGRKLHRARPVCKIIAKPKPKPKPKPILKQKAKPISKPQQKPKKTIFSPQKKVLHQYTKLFDQPTPLTSLNAIQRKKIEEAIHSILTEALWTIKELLTNFSRK